MSYPQASSLLYAAIAGFYDILETRIGSARHRFLHRHRG